MINAKEFKFTQDNIKNITANTAVEIYENTPISTLIAEAQKIRYNLNPQKKVSWQTDMNVNYTNVCISGCKFCNFHCKIHQEEKSYTLKERDYIEKLKILHNAGGNQFLLQGGLHPKYDINYYKTLFRRLKELSPNLKLNALGPPEIAHISRISNISIKDTLQQLKEAGLDTLPGAGAEILSDRVRKIISPAKPTVEEWIDVMKTAHQMGFSTTATMVYGHIETINERMEHLILLRDIQKVKPKDAPGFRAFICWPMQLKNTELQKLILSGNINAPHYRKQTVADFIKMTAISRIILYNIPHIQASWLTVGTDAAKLALHAGADDMGSIMIEENVVSSAGANHTNSRESIQQAIIDAGFTPWERDQQYNAV